MNAVCLPPTASRPDPFMTVEQEGARSGDVTSLGRLKQLRVPFQWLQECKGQESKVAPKGGFGTFYMSSITLSTSVPIFRSTVFFSGSDQTHF